MFDEGANEGTFFVVDIKSLRYASMWKNTLIKFISGSWIANLCFCDAYKEVIKVEDDEFSWKTDDEGMCIFV